MTRNDAARTRGWLIAMALAAGLAILGAYGIPGRWLHYLVKPLATLCAAALVAGAGAGARRYRIGVLGGLVLSTLGDVLLMLPGDLFAAGLAAFLGAHLAYLYAFTDGVGLAQRPLPFLAYGALAAALTAVLWPGIPVALRAPVLAYVCVLAGMAAQAGTRAAVQHAPAARLAALGGATFVLSDAALALDRFRWPSAGAAALVLASYWLAQALIALSVVRAASTGTRN